jgi:hypothetical protein
MKGTKSFGKGGQSNCEKWKRKNESENHVKRKEE